MPQSNEKAPIHTSEAGVHFKKPSEIIKSKAGKEHIRMMYEVFPPPQENGRARDRSDAHDD